MIIAQLLIFALQIYSYVILARVLLSWIPNIDRNNPLVQMLYDLTEPVLKPFRDMMPANSGIDFSPIMVYLVIIVLTQVLRAFAY